ncbi:c-type cytochrome biogenesis protein CcmI [Rhizobium sp. AN80A]|uniref:c-type cytochrome biogenesis protein CcmI n=1 Tax=Rhizobium sp. AN80A TaxID=3040673 RepID=UPI000DB91484|nr:c-type cytochrome biogenesis protein CcmI [Rhizobium sp. AN80A]
MLIWIIFAVLTTAVTAALLHPLSPERPATAADRFNKGRVYRDQLAELDRELASGQIADSEFQLAKAETARRLLRLKDPISTAAPSTQASSPWRVAIAAFLSLASISVYLTLGSPELPARPLRQRLDNPGQDIAILIRKTEEHLARDPTDGRGWEVIAPIYLHADRVADAFQAYSNAIRILGPSPARMDGLAETLMAASGGAVTDDARRALEQSLALQINNPRARFYIALGLEQAGKADEARAGFEVIAKQSPPDAPWMPLVSEHIVKNGGTPAAGNAPATAAAPLGGPTQADVAAADQMNSGDRQQMIRGMVDSLDAKLTENPDNLDGWLRLVRSYMVLNDKDRAAAALKRGLTAFPADGEKGKQLVALAHELGLPADAAATQGTMQ